MTGERDHLTACQANAVFALSLQISAAVPPRAGRLASVPGRTLSAATTPEACGMKKMMTAVRIALWNTKLKLRRSAMRVRDNGTLRLRRFGALRYRAGRFPMHLAVQRDEAGFLFQG